MIQIPNPQDKKYTQTNRSDVFLPLNYYNPLHGNLWATFNIDLQSNPGVVRVGSRMKIVGKTGDTNLTNMTGAPVGFTEWGAFIYFISGSRVFYMNSNGPTIYGEDTSTSYVTTYNNNLDDLASFNKCVVSVNASDQKLRYLSGGIWGGPVSSIAGGTSSNIYLTYFKKFDRLYIADSVGPSVNGPQILSVDTSWALSSIGNAYAISFTTNTTGHIKCMAAGSDKIWIGMHNAPGYNSMRGDETKGCSMYEWDGISNQITREYKIPAKGVMSIVIDENDIPIIMDSNGILRKFNGQGFPEIGRLPVPNGEVLWTNYYGKTESFIHPRGLVLSKNNTILASVFNRNQYLYKTDTTTDTSQENLPSGIWEFDGKGSAVHLHSFSYMPFSSTTVTDHGQNRVYNVGELARIQIMQYDGTYEGTSTLIAGATISTDATTHATAAVYLSAPSPSNSASYPEGQKYGYYVTTWLHSTQATEMWRKAFLNYGQLINSTDKIVVKYRNKKATPTVATITWTSTTTFTTTTDVTAYWTSGTGGEVEILQGVGSGKCSHITSIVNNAGTYTVTVDETYTGCTSGTAKARFQNWIKAGSITDQGSDVKDFSLTAANGKPYFRVQVKVCMQFTGDNEVHQLSVVSSPHQPLA